MNKTKTEGAHAPGTRVRSRNGSKVGKVVEPFLAAGKQYYRVLWDGYGDTQERGHWDLVPIAIK